MKINKKDICLVAGGTVFGVIIGGSAVIYKAVTSETLRPAIVDAISTKILDVAGYSRTSYRWSEKMAPKVSYRSYCERYSKTEPKFDTNIVFETRQKAEGVVESLLEIYKSYGCVTVCDLYDVSDIPANYESTKYGWVKEYDIDARIVRVNGGYMIKLPPPKKLV